MRKSPDPKELLDKIKGWSGPPVTIMEVCGTHTVAIARMGLRGLLPPNVKLLSGPGCPVCVTPVETIDQAIYLAEKGAILATYGDAVRVPGSRTTLAAVRGAGAFVAPVYSAMDALKLATENPERQVVFLGLGFETTSPTVAFAIRQAKAGNIGNFSVLAAHKALMPAMDVLASDPEMRVNAFLCPGHASMVIGLKAYRPLCAKFELPCVVAGFGTDDVLTGLAMILDQLEKGEAKVENAYPRAVTEEGNPAALASLAEVYRIADGGWRGLGELPGSCYAIADEYEHFDAEKRFLAGVTFEGREPPGCRCAEVLRGRAEPKDCKLFATACTPENPVGACMVSSEGACGAHYRYRGVD